MLPQAQADQICLATTVYLEARDQPVLGQRAVAEVALRRLDTGRHGDSVCAVVRAPGQFAPSMVPGAYRLDDAGAFATANQVAERALSDWALPPRLRRQVVPGAKYFIAYANTNPNWVRGDPVATIGAHAFYSDAF
jgi:spore germination cell wall hydrolase CwlJ-like protein